MLPIQMTRRQVSLLQKGGLKIDWREFVKGHTVAGEEEMAVVRQFVRDCYAETAKE